MTSERQNVSKSLFGQLCAYSMSCHTHHHTCPRYLPKEQSSQVSKRFEKYLWSYCLDKLGHTDRRTDTGNDNTPLALALKGEKGPVTSWTHLIFPECVHRDPQQVCRRGAWLDQYGVSGTVNLHPLVGPPGQLWLDQATTAGPRQVLQIQHIYNTSKGTSQILNMIICWFSARLQWLQCIINGVTAGWCQAMKMRQETFKFWDSVCLISEIWWWGFQWKWKMQYVMISIFFSQQWTVLWITYFFFAFQRCHLLRDFFFSS